MFGIIIDEEGCKKDFVVLDVDKMPRFYKLQEGEQVVEQGWQIANAMNKPQWQFDAKEWIDTDPMPPVEPPAQQPNKMEVLERENRQLWDTVEMLLKANGFLSSEDPIYQIKE